MRVAAPICLIYYTKRSRDKIEPIFGDLAQEWCLVTIFWALFFCRDLLNSTRIMQAGNYVVVFWGHATYGRVSRTMHNRVAF